MRLLIEHKGEVHEVEDRLEYYDLQKPFAQAEIVRLILRTIEIIKEES